MGNTTEFAKKLLGIHPQQGVEPLETEHIGSTYHGYYVPKGFLSSNSVCYCIGAGDDISFDTELKVLHDAKVFIFDPMPEGILHFKKLKEFAKHNQPLSIHGQAPFTYRISADQLDTVTFVEIGVWDKKDTLKFYEPTREGYPSHSVYLFKESGKYIEAPVDKLSTLMQQLGHTSVDLVKIEIEGAEYTVIDSILEDKLDIKLILVEFDEIHNPNGKLFHLRIKKTCDKLRKAGYVLVHSTDTMKRSFLRRDVFEKLKAKNSHLQSA
ncbi:FkbM family methyltransferase [Spirosoma sp. BT702]|uniref:FkbM family methyltransferase n=1 Tax=Spirosoma profusum TaxID=2771354 RepID=A0A927APY4_9BACT|nr:FkbM family methyltransferase [Spirosoma profusum]MBD2699313.1 FkbM family methyltransferase [Spirosoma profusum]